MEVVPGISMLEMVLRKVRLALLLNDIVVTTLDEKIGHMVREMHANVYVWELQRDPIGELWNAGFTFWKEVGRKVSDGYGKDMNIVRITADCPLIRPEIIDKCVQEFLDRDVDLVYNSFYNTGADGSDVEVFSMSTLEQANKNATEREHPTVWMRNHLKTHYVETPIPGCSVDTMEDLQKVRQIFREGEYGS